MKKSTQLVEKERRRQRRRFRLRKVVSGTPERPRLVVHRSLRNIEAQVVDDVAGRSLAGISTLTKELRGRKFGSRIEQGREVGRQIAAMARERGISKVVFDRGGFLYHGIVKAVAEGAREGGLKL
ncbi:MAG: 50S ribosomal protein L18 [Candidatus Latescibacterota bacterium]